MAGRKDQLNLNRAMSMAEAAPILSTTPRSQMGSAFQEGDSFAAGTTSASGASTAAIGAGRSGAGGSSSNSRKPGSASTGRSGRSKPRPGGVHAHVAAYEGDLGKLRRYAEAGGDLEKRDSYRATPLLLAAEKAREDRGSSR